MFSRELNAINDVKHDKQKCNRIIDEGGMELVHCICDCIHNILQGNIPVDEDELEILKRHKECLRKLAKERDFRPRKETSHTGGWISRISHPYTCGISRKTLHRTIMDEIKNMHETDSSSCK